MDVKTFVKNAKLSSFLFSQLDDNLSFTIGSN